MIEGTPMLKPFLALIFAGSLFLAVDIPETVWPDEIGPTSDECETDEKCD